MDSARISVTALCLAGLMLMPIPASSAPPQTPPGQAKKAESGDCSKAGQEPNPHAGSNPNRKCADPRAPEPSPAPDDGSGSDDPSKEESDMKSNEGNFAAVAALLMAVASGGASAANESLSVSHCRVEDGRADTVVCFGNPDGTEDCHTIPTGSAGGTVCRVLSVAGNGGGAVTPVFTQCPNGRIGSGLDATGSGTVSLKVTVNSLEVFNQTRSFSEQDAWALPTGKQLPRSLCIQRP